MTPPSARVILRNVTSTFHRLIFVLVVRFFEKGERFERDYSTRFGFAGLGKPLLPKRISSVCDCRRATSLSNSISNLTQPSSHRTHIFASVSSGNNLIFPDKKASSFLSAVVKFLPVMSFPVKNCDFRFEYPFSGRFAGSDFKTSD